MSWYQRRRRLLERKPSGGWWRESRRQLLLEGNHGRCVHPPRHLRPSPSADRLHRPCCVLRRGRYQGAIAGCQGSSSKVLSYLCLTSMQHEAERDSLQPEVFSYCFRANNTISALSLNFNTNIFIPKLIVFKRKAGFLKDKISFLRMTLDFLSERYLFFDSFSKWNDLDLPNMLSTSGLVVLLVIISQVDWSQKNSRGREKCSAVEGKDGGGNQVRVVTHISNMTTSLLPSILT